MITRRFVFVRSLMEGQFPEPVMLYHAVRLVNGLALLE
jgi:hypothetical protein